MQQRIFSLSQKIKDDLDYFKHKKKLDRKLFGNLYPYYFFDKVISNYETDPDDGSDGVVLIGYSQIDEMVKVIESNNSSNELAQIKPLLFPSKSKELVLEFLEEMLGEVDMSQVADRYLISFDMYVGVQEF